MAPFVTALLGKGLQLVANAALTKGKDWIKQKTGVDLDKSQLSSEDYVALRKFEMEHEEELLRMRLEDNKLGIELTKAYLADTADARARERAVLESPVAPLLAKLTPTILAWGTVILTFSMFYYFANTEFDPNSPRKDIVIYILGVLSTITTQIFSYYFGSSQGSAEKSKMLDKMMLEKEAGK
jgi:hypothetical protein